MGGDSSRHSPGHSLLGNYPTGRTPAYSARSPHITYTGTGYYGGTPVGAGMHSNYSPTNLMGTFQTPSYSPTTPNYG